MRNRMLLSSSKNVEAMVLALPTLAGRKKTASAAAGLSYNRLTGRNLAVERNEGHGRIVDNYPARRQNKSAGSTVRCIACQLGILSEGRPIMATAVATVVKKQNRKERIPKALP